MTSPYAPQFGAPPQQYAAPAPQFAAPAPAPAVLAPQQYAPPVPAPVAFAPQQPAVQPQPAQQAPLGPAQFGTFVPAPTGKGTGERYDKFVAKDHQEKPLMVRFLEVYTFTSTQGNTKGQQVQCVKVDVFDMRTQQIYVNASWSPARLVEQVAHLAGDGQVYGIELYGSPTRSGNTMIAAREITDPGTLAMARQMAAQVGAAFDHEHQVRQAEAAQAAVAQQAGGLQQMPGGFGAAQAVGYPAQQTHGPAAGFAPQAQPVQQFQAPQAPGPIASMPAQQSATADALYAGYQAQQAAQMAQQFPAPQEMDYAAVAAQAGPPQAAQWQAQQAAQPGGVPPMPAAPQQTVDAAAVQAAISGLTMAPTFQPAQG